MKKLNLSPRAKKSLVVIGMAAICVGVVTLISQFNTGAAADQMIASSSAASSSSEVSVPEIVVASDLSSASSAFVPSSGASAVAPLTTISKPTSAPPNPVISGNSSALTKKSSKPSYSSKPAVSRTATSKPSGGKPGQVYDPVFGWQYPTGGQVTVVSGMHEGGSQVGIMD